MKKFLSILGLLAATVAIAQVPSNVLDIGDNTATDKRIRAKIPGVCKPELRWNQGLQKWQATNDCSIYNDIGFSSSSVTPNSDLGALSQYLSQAESSTVPETPNTMYDTYTSSQGTYSNMTASAGKASLNAGQTAGSQERTRQTSMDMGRNLGVVRIASQALAPKATTIVSNTIVFSGDVCEFFPASKDVVIFKETTSDSLLNHQYLKDAGNKVARLARSSCSYSAGPDESTLVVSNPNALDLDFDLTSGQYAAQLRVSPFDYNLKTKASAAASYETNELSDGRTTGTLRIPAEVLDSFTVRASTLTGSVIRHGIGCSPNGTYCFGVAVEILASNAATYHFYYSANAGTSWTKYAYTEAVPTSQFLEDLLHGYLMTPQVRVADNGKAFAIFHNGSVSLNYHVKGVYSDISAGSPAVTQSVAFTADAENSVGTAGYICANTTNNRTAFLEADRTDLSFIAVACVRQNATLGYRFFTNGGATYQNSDLGAYSHQYGSRAGLTVTGSGSSHRVFAYNKNGATNIQYRYYDQPSATAVGSGTAFTGDGYLYDCESTSTKAYCLFRDNATDEPKYYSWTVTGSPTISSAKALAPQLDLDDYIGLDIYENSSSDPYNYGKIPGHYIAVNPSDANNVFFVTDMTHADGIVRPVVHEVRNDASFNGAGPSNTTVSGNQNLGYNTSSQQLAQTFTATFAPLRTVSFRVRQVGDISKGNTLTAQLYATSGGEPTGSPIATSLNSYTEDQISKSGSYQHVFFRFNETLSVSTVYAIVLQYTHTLSTTNFINIPSGVGYGGGSGYRWDGSSWVSTGDDLVFEVNGEWQYDLSAPIAKWYGDTDQFAWGTDTSISLTPTSGVLSVVTKKSPTGSSQASVRQSGHVFKGTIAIGSGSTASTLSTLSALGYPAATFQPGMVFQTQPGTTESSRKDAVTGVVSATEKAEDRSGMNATAVYTGVTYRSQAGCDSGQAIVFDASGDKVDYGAGTSNVYDVGQLNAPFSVEAQFVLDTLPSVKGFFSTIASKYTDPTANQGWIFYVNTSNRLVFQFTIGGGTTTGSTTSFTTGTVYRVKATGDGTTVRLYVHNGSTWVQEAYSAQVTAGYDASTTTDQLEIGNIHNNSAAYDLRGALCYLKIQKGESDMLALGYTSQPEILHPINAGRLAGALQGIGTGTLTINTGFNQWGTAPILGGSSSVVDSYEDEFTFTRVLSTVGNFMHWLLEAGRGSDRNQSAIYGTAVRFSK